jgi:hypothetical protein
MPKEGDSARHRKQAQRRTASHTTGRTKVRLTVESECPEEFNRVLETIRGRSERPSIFARAWGGIWSGLRWLGKAAVVMLPFFREHHK